MAQVWKIVANILRPYSPQPIVLGQIAGSVGNSFYIKNTGQSFGWGGNTFGQIGDNTAFNQKNTPVCVLGSAKTFCKISAGDFYTLAIDKNGKLWSWGYNNNGQLGVNSTTSQRTPVSVLGATKTFCKISAFIGFSLGIDKNGRAWSWGINTRGQLGDNSVTQRLTPVSVAGATKTFCEISAGGTHTVAVDKNGLAWSWGANTAGQLGINSTISFSTPVAVLGNTKTFCKVSAGLNFTTAIDKNGQAWAWGIASLGQLGNNSTTSQRTPVSVLGVTKTFCEISSGYNHTVAIDKNGQAWGWGGNFSGQLGNNDTLNKQTPVSVVGNIKTFCKIQAGGSHTLAIDYKGLVWSWGINSGGQLGDNLPSITCKTSPVSVAGNLKTFCKISAGVCFTVAIDKNGQAWGWGINDRNQLGDNTQISRITPVSVAGVTKTFCQIAGGGCFTVAIDKNGQSWAWGLNSFGQLGNNSTSSYATPVSVAGVTKTFCKIAAGGCFTVAIDKNGQSWGWGLNTTGQLGDNSLTSRRTPVSVLGATKTFCKIVAGNAHTIAIDKNGRAWGWGLNNNGQLGDNSIISQRTPVSVLGATKTFCEIASQGPFTVAIDKNGQAWGWGNNNQGRLGNNSTLSQRTPVSVLGTNKTFCKIAAGWNHTAAIDKYGQAWGWGYNDFGQLGDNSITSRMTPVSVTGAKKTFCEIAAGGCHTVAIDKYGQAWGWGYNDFGQLGSNEGPKYTPIRVCNL